MAQREPDVAPSVEQIVELARKLPVEELNRLIDLLQVEWLRAEIAVGTADEARGDLYDAQDVFAELLERNDSFRKR